MLLTAFAVAVVTAPCSQAQTQIDIDTCTAASAKRSDAELNATYARVRAGLKELGIDPDLLVPVQLAWISARDATCTFEASLYEGGSIAPSIYSGCLDAMTLERTRRLQTMLAARRASHGSAPAPIAVSSAAASDLAHVTAAYEKNVDAGQRTKFDAAHIAWVSYRDKACAIEGGDCITQLDRDRVAQLKSAWMGDPIW
jgi:uncharacterized protein YecT (DUF1311 family)